MVNKMPSKILLLCISLIALIAVLPAAHADTEIFDGTVLAGYVYNTSIGQAFKLAYFETPTAQEVAIDFPTETLIIENNTCSTGKRLKGCFTGSTFHGYNYSLPNRLVYDYKIKITLLAPDIEIISLVDNDTVEVGEKTTVHVNVTNAGKASGEIYLTSKAPGDIELIELPDQQCQLSVNNTLVLRVDLRAGQISHCDYKVSPNSPGTYILTSSAEFDVVNRIRKQASSTITAKALPILINSSFNNQILLGDKLNIAFSVNASQQVQSFSFNAVIPGQFSIISVDKPAKKEQDGNTARISYFSGPGLTENITMNVSAYANSVGIFPMLVNLSWRLRDFKQKMQFEFPINVSMASPYFRLNSFDPSTRKASIDVVNLAHLPIHNVVVNFASFASEDGSPLSAESIGSFGSASFNIIQTSGDGNFNGTIRYSTPMDQELTAEARLPVTPEQIIIQPLAPNESPSASEPAPSPPPASSQESQPQTQQPAKSTGNLSKSLLKKSPLSISLMIIGAIVVLLIFGMMRIIKKQQGGGPISQ